MPLPFEPPSANSCLVDDQALAMGELRWARGLLLALPLDSEGDVLTVRCAVVSLPTGEPL